jgi:hypothetical protein
MEEVLVWIASLSVKIAKHSEALKLLKREAVALRPTGRVVELHCQALTSVFFSRGILVTKYCPEPPPQEEGFETTLSLVELELGRKIGGNSSGFGVCSCQRICVDESQTWPYSHLPRRQTLPQYHYCC